MRIALTIAGSDSCGGAGIQADLETFAAFGVFAFHSARSPPSRPRTPSGWSARMTSIRRWWGHRSGRCHRPAPARRQDGHACQRRHHRHGDRVRYRVQHPPLVVDPVMVASSGDVLLEPEAVVALRSRLLPLADLITPNLAEAEVLTGQPVRNRSEMRAAAIALVEMGASAALVKGASLRG